MVDESFEQAQQQMLDDAMTQGKPSSLDKLNQLLWPECSVCAGWRGVFIGILMATATGIIWKFIG